MRFNFKLDPKMNIHFIAIGGSAMHNLALALHERGDTLITGSDDAIFEPSKTRLRMAGLLPQSEGWFVEKINNNIDAVIIGMHAKKENPELIRAQKLGLNIFSYPEFLFESSKAKTRVVIGGSHGKTSTTSMLLHSLRLSNVDVDFMVGAQLDGYNTMVRLSNDSEWAVFEGDEYLSSPIDLRPKFHLYRANVAILTGIAWDHINVFPTIDDYRLAFEGFLKSMEPGGTLIYNEDDKDLEKIVIEDNSPIRKIPYHMPKYRIQNGRWIWITPQGDLPLSFIGKHNLSNAEGARWLAQEMGVQAEDFYDALTSFKGAKSRLEVLKSGTKRIIHLDFAHAPSKVRATVEAYCETYIDEVTIGLLELHTFSSLNSEFISGYKDSLDGLDKAIVFFDPKSVAHKNLPELKKDEVQSAFGSETLVLTSIDEMQKTLYNLPEKCNLLIMSSGDLGGFDIRAYAENCLC